MLPILNYRAGFACNSSSSHSVVFIGNRRLEDELAIANGYGWDNFTLATPEAKQQYFEQQLLAQAYYETPQAQLKFVNTVVKAIPALSAEDLREKLSLEEGARGYVDHQSVWALPMKYDESALLESYLQTLWSAVMRDDVAVLGGNDNGDDHPLAETSKPVWANAWRGDRWGWRAARLPQEESGLVGRDDGTHLTLFNRRAGGKVRLAKFDRPGIVIKSSARPELVDVKVTDWCDKGCKYCYQGSTTDGKHADFGALKEVLDALAELEVFEVAFGGGEPTAHPRFLEVLEYARKLHITPNFTTRNLDWVKANAAAIREYCGAFAFSVDSAAQAKALMKVVSVAKLRDRVQLQVVDGAVTTATLRAIKNVEAYTPLLLLGWKTTGRGNPALRKECDWEAALKTEYGEAVDRVHCDTAFYDEYKDRFTALRADPRTIGGPEGTFSCYVDAVSGRIAPSSFCAESEYQQLEPFQMAGSFNDAWQAIRTKAESSWDGMRAFVDDAQDEV